MKQVFHNKGSGGHEGRAIRRRTHSRTSTSSPAPVSSKFPVTDEKPLDLARELDRLARERQAHLPAQLADQLPLPRADLDAHRAEARASAAAA